MKDRFSAEKIRWAERQHDRSLSSLSTLILRAYKFRALRRVCLSLCDRLEGGFFYSQTRREIMKQYYGVTVGRYSYGPCLDPGVFPYGSEIGAYCSFGSELMVFRRNHPAETLTQHPFFYNRYLNIVDQDTIPLDQDNPLSIGNDVWIGSRTTILPGCKRIGDGAIIGANSVVTKDVDDFAIVAGNPAKEFRRRFTPEVAELVKKSEWWNLSLPELMKANDLLFDPVTKDGIALLIQNMENTDRTMPPEVTLKMAERENARV